MTLCIHEIGRPSGGSFGQTSAVDIDRDGDLDRRRTRNGDLPNDIEPLSGVMT